MCPCPTHRRAYAGRLHTGGTPATIMELDWGHLVHDIAGLCKYTGDKPEEVVAVHWLDLGEPEAAWVVKVQEIGPLVVGIDSSGESLFAQMRSRTAPNLARIYQEAGIEPAQKLAYLPKRVPASTQPTPR